MRYYHRLLVRCFHGAKRLARVPTRLTISHETAGAILLSLANETERLYSFVREFLTKRWFCDANANQTQQPPRNLRPRDLQRRVFPGLCAAAVATGPAAGPPTALASA